MSKRHVFLFMFFCMLQNLYASSNTNIYEHTQAGLFSPAVKNALFRVYVPNSRQGNVSVIDPLTYKVIDTFATGKEPQHVVPSYDLQTLWVLNDKGNSATPIDPTTGKPGTTLSVNDPYNLYFTPDGRSAIVVCEARKQLEFRDPKSMALKYVIPHQCKGSNHMDFTPDGRYAIVTCEYNGQLMKVDLLNQKVIGYLSLNIKKPSKKNLDPPPLIKKPTPINTGSNTADTITIQADGHVVVADCSKPRYMPTLKSRITSMPQDIRSSADGKIFYVADMLRNGVVLIDPVLFTEIGFIPTGMGTHAIYPSRDGKLFYVSNRGCCRLYGCKPHGPGNISIIDPEQRKVIATWQIAQGGSPDMGNVTADGKELWLSGRYDNEVYVFDTSTGQLTHRIPVGKGPHGLTVWPQPGQYSLGHTGNMR